MDLVVPVLEVLINIKEEPEEDQMEIDQPDDEYFEEYEVGKNVGDASSQELLPAVIIECLVEDIEEFQYSGDFDEKVKDEEEGKEILLQRDTSVLKHKKMKKEVPKFVMKTKDFHLPKKVFKRKDIELKVLKLVNSTKIKFYKDNRPRFGRKLLVLDVDLTLMDNVLEADMRRIGTPTYENFARPYLHEFLNSLAEDYDFAFWSQTQMRGIIRKLTALQIIGPNCRQNYPIVFILDDKSMVNTHLERGDRFYNRKQEIKALSFIWHKFSTWYNKSNTIHLDDLKRNFVMNAANGLLIPAFRCTQISLTQDRDLLLVARYLLSIVQSGSDFSQLDHTLFRDCDFAFQYSDFLASKNDRIPFVGIGNRLDSV